jgi:amino acid transporter
MQAGAPRRVLTLLDSTCLIVGIIVGAGIYQTAPEVARGAGSVGGVLAIWTLGGLLSLCGALGYAELATALPRAGGDAVYLGRAYGAWAGFLFGWVQTLIVRPGDIAVMAFAFATYARAGLGAAAPAEPVLAAGARITYALGRDHRAFRALGRWSDRTGTPVSALLLQAAIAVVLILSLGSFVETLLYTAAAVYLFYLATSLAVIVLRIREPDLERPFRVPGHPWPSLIFAGVCLFLIHAAVTYRPATAAIAAGLILLGLPVYAWSARRRNAT